MSKWENKKKRTLIRWDHCCWIWDTMYHELDVIHVSTLLENLLLFFVGRFWGRGMWMESKKTTRGTNKGKGIQQYSMWPSFGSSMFCNASKWGSTPATNECVHNLPPKIKLLAKIYVFVKSFFFSPVEQNFFLWDDLLVMFNISLWLLSDPGARLIVQGIFYGPGQNIGERSQYFNF